MRRTGLIPLLFILVGCATPQYCEGVASGDKMICTHNRDEDVTKQRIRALTEQAARERRTLVAYLGNDVGQVTMVVREKGIAHHRPPASIYIPTRLIVKDHAITAHEITHLLTQGWASQVLKEGLAVHVQYRFGEQQGWPNYRRTVRAAARHWRNDPGLAVHTPNDADRVLRPPGGDKMERRRAAYSIAGSWVMWLIERKFDSVVGRFLDSLYRSGDYQSALNQNYASLLQEWRSFLKTQ